MGPRLALNAGGEGLRASFAFKFDADFTATENRRADEPRAGTAADEIFAPNSASYRLEESAVADFRGRATRPASESTLARPPLTINGCKTELMERHVSISSTTPAPPYVDRPEIDECYADGVQSMGVVNGNFMITMYVIRGEQDLPTMMKRVTAARLVIPPKAAIELHEKLTAMLKAMKQQSVVQAADRPKAIQ